MQPFAHTANSGTDLGGDGAVAKHNQITQRALIGSRLLHLIPTPKVRDWYISNEHFIVFSQSIIFLTHKVHLP